MNTDNIYIFIGPDGTRLTIWDCQTGSRSGDVHIDFNVPGDPASFMRLLILRGYFGGGWHSTRGKKPMKDPHFIIRKFLKTQVVGEQQVDWLVKYNGEANILTWKSLVNEDRPRGNCPIIGADYFIAQGDNAKEWVFGAQNRFLRANVTPEERQSLSEFILFAIPIKINTKGNPLLENFFQGLYELGIAENGYISSPLNDVMNGSGERCVP